jgi:hypothetical protein
MDRVEITGIFQVDTTTAMIGRDTTDGQTKVGIIVTLAGQDGPVLLLMAEPVAADLEQLLAEGHLPT